MTLTQITYFNAVCEYKNVTKAANALFVSRTAVSRALKDLENEWDLVLFKRSRTGVELTEDGERVREIFTDFNNAYMALKKSVNDRRRSQESPELRIGITTTTGSRFFPEFFRNFRESHPDIRLRIVEYSVYESAAALLSGTIDFSITPHIVYESGYRDALEKVSTYTSELVLCVGREHPLSRRTTVTEEDLEGLDMASLMTPLPNEDLSDLEFRQLISEEDWSYVLRSSQQQLIRKAVAAGFTAIVLPREIAEGWSDICRISFDPPRLFPVYIVWNRTLKPSKAQLAFQEYIRRYWSSEQG